MLFMPMLFMPAFLFQACMPPPRAPMFLFAAQGEGPPRMPRIFCMPRMFPRMPRIIGPPRIPRIGIPRGLKPPRMPLTLPLKLPLPPAPRALNLPRFAARLSSAFLPNPFSLATLLYRSTTSLAFSRSNSTNWISLKGDSASSGNAKLAFISMMASSGMSLQPAVSWAFTRAL